MKIQQFAAEHALKEIKKNFPVEVLVGVLTEDSPYTQPLWCDDIHGMFSMLGSSSRSSNFGQRFFVTWKLMYENEWLQKEILNLYKDLFGKEWSPDED